MSERRKELVLAPVERAERLRGALALLEVPANLVLALASAQSRANRAHESGDANGTLEQRDVPERANRVGGRFGIRAPTGEQQHRKIGPWRLRSDHGR